jgi:hypothetical protein
MTIDRFRRSPKKSPACAGLGIAIERWRQSDAAAWLMMMLPKPVV